MNTIKIESNTAPRHIEISLYALFCKGVKDMTETKNEQQPTVSNESWGISLILLKHILAGTPTKYLKTECKI